MPQETVDKEPIAIIGLGCVLPDAPDVATFWKNLLEGRSSIREVPKERWDPELFWNPDKEAPERTYSKIGAFVLDDAFNGIDYRMPPKTVEQIDPSQRWALSATRQAFLDAGYRTGLKADEARGGKDFDRERCAVILGNAMGGEQMKLQAKNLYWPQVEAALRADPDFAAIPDERRDAVIARAKLHYQAGVPPVTEDSMPGTLANVAAGRIANVFDLSGKNFTTDAACASSLAALDAAVDTLRKQEADLVVWGGTDRSMDITPYVEFSKIGALSPDGSRPFDKDANGFVMGEGCATFLLKRLSDAERDGDLVYAVVRGVGGSSDGKGKGITAPNPVGQVKAILRAHQDAGIDPYTIGHLEAHGTSTPVGDPVELTSAVEAFRTLSGTKVPPGSIAVGSVKSNMGHLKSAAGAVGMLKTVLALHHGRLPPTINVREPNPRIDWEESPFRVQAQVQDWPEPGDHPRRAAVSSFGFGGTNFHVVVEQHVPGRLVVRPMAQVQARSTAGGMPVLDEDAFRHHMIEAGALEAEPLVLDGAQAARAVASLPTVRYAETGQGPRVRSLFRPLTEAGLVAKTRVGIAPADPTDVPKKLALAQKAATDPAAARLAFNQGVFLGRGEPQGKVAFLFPGQGTQYVNMLRDLADKYEVVRNTFREADQILYDDLGGVRLTDILWPSPDTPEARKQAEEKLKLTEFTQPAVLAADVALLRLLAIWGIKPDVVAGHSLGEYGALVAAGVLTFADALHAVAARGREMASVDVPDLGKMASVSAGWQDVQDVITGVDGYVIPANKNCPSQTVIAGSSDGVDAAVQKCQERGLQVQYLPVSAAFHSEIVAPASAPLRRVLGRLDVQPPRVRVLSNVGAEPYPQDPDRIRDNLAVQVASPVEWVGIVDRMYAEGVRTFIEVGPKRALTGFVLDILKEKGDAVAICSNHPKKGGVTHINELFAFLGAWGFRPHLPDLDDPSVYTKAFRDPTAAFRRTPAPAAAPTTPPPPVRDPRLDVITDGLRRLVQDLERIGPAADGAAAASAPSAASVPPVVAAAPPPVAATSATEATALRLRERVDAFGFCLDDVGVAGISVGLPGKDKPLFDAKDWDRILAGENLIDPLSEPERGRLADKNIVRLVKGSGGEARFQAVDDVAQVIQLAGKRGGFDITEWGVDADFASVLDRTFQYAIAAGIEALRDAGIPLQRTYVKTSTGGYLPKEWKLPEALRDETGIVFASAFPGYDNLIRDISRYLADKYAGRSLDELQRLYDELTGIIEDDGLRDRVREAFDDEFERLQDVLPDHGAARYEFNRKFLFSVLSMGHAQLAQFIGARGPNTQLNAACASTTQAISVAEDWIRTGRCRRVIVVGADDVTSDAMFEWIGSGFLASGAATTKSDVAEAALPFDRRRHGMIVGMGAVGLVVEAAPETEKRGMRPVARLLATRVANSAFHGSRLDVEHISSEMRALVAAAGRRYGIRPDEIAAQTVFMSHETYTPARGGSASAEIHALRATFGDAANRVVIANTKGFTGHPQGAGIEDAIALKCLQRGRVPPIANFRDPDPELGDLNLSTGGAYDVRYALRLAAGFGSQVAMTLTELVAREDERVADPAAYARWLGDVSGLPGATTEIQNRTLRIVDPGAPPRETPVAAPAPAGPLPDAAPPASPVPAPSAPALPGDGDERPTAGASEAAVLDHLIGLVAEKTGYPLDLLDPDLDMEADLGIDTVKQAELFGLMREEYSIPLEDGLQIKDYPTLRAVARYMADRATGGPPSDHADGPAAAAPGTDGGGRGARPVQTTLAAAEPDPAMPAVPAEVPGPSSATSAAPSPSVGGADGQAVLDRLITLVAEKTGYPVDMLEPDLDMEADLGIDTVKQAELFGLMREEYSIPLEDGLQIKDYPTLRAVARYMAERATGGFSPASVAAAPLVTDDPADDPADKPAEDRTDGPADDAALHDADGPGEAAVLAKVTELVAEKTGYPAEMLEPELDMEADLGIDTVKQAELFGQVRETFGIPLVDGLQIKDYPTLRAVAGFVVAHAGHAATAAPASVTEPTDATSIGPAAPRTETPDGSSAPAATSRAPDSAIVRRVPCLRPEPRPGDGPALQRGVVLVVGDPENAVMDAFKSAGFDPRFHLADDESPAGLLVLATRADPDAAEARLGAAFDAAKRHRGALADGGFVAVVTAQDGAHGLVAPHDPGMAGLAGLGKALRKELPGALVKVIDLHPDAVAARNVLEEVLHGGPRTEVAYSAEGLRHVVDVAPQALGDAAPDLAGRTLVVSGGAQGITAEILTALAPQGPRLLLLGRTALPEEAAAWAALDAEGWKAKEQEAILRLREEGARVTPVAVQKALAPMRRAAEVQRNLDRLRAAGAEVRYEALDVTDAEAVQAAVAGAREAFGPIHGVVHAAGVEISKDLSEKDRAQFDLVLGVKLRGWRALMEATREDPVDLLVGFGSVAGRFGNLGQVDYSAANEWLAKAVRAEAAARGASTAFTVSWGPWGEVGMATRGSILQIMEASGVTPIPTDVGLDAFLRELATPGVRESVVAGALGAIDVDGQVVETAWDPALAALQERLAAEPEACRLLEAVRAAGPGRLEATVVLDRARDPYLDDHSIDGVPTFPGVFGIEAFAEAARLLAPDDAVLLGAEDVRFASPLKQLKERPVEAVLTAETASAEEEPETRVRCRLTTRFVAADGNAYGEPRLHFEATMRFGEQPEAQTVEVPACDGTRARSDIYPPFFHGPSFQVLDAAGPFGEEAVGRYRPPEEPHFAAGPARFLSHPMVGEALFQLCGLHTMERDAAMSLPLRLERLDLFSPDAREIVLWCRPAGATDDGHRRFEAAAVTEEGRLVIRMDGYAMIETGALPAPAQAGTDGATEAVDGDAPPEATENGAQGGEAEEAPDDGASAPTVSVAPVTAEGTPIPEAPVALPGMDGVVFAAVDVVEGAPADPAWFHEGEQGLHGEFLVPKRAAEWRAGRLAAKAAVLKASPGLDPRAVEVRNDGEDGRPVLWVDGRMLDVPLSITHRDGIAVAAVAEQEIGIDLETVEARPEAFLEEAFNGKERDALAASASPELETACMWAAKEAAFKRARTGLRASLRDHTVTADDRGGAVVRGPLGTFGIQFYDVAGRVLAVSHPAHDPPGAEAAAAKRAKA